PRPASQAPEAMATASPSLVAPTYRVAGSLMTRLISGVRKLHGTPVKKSRPRPRAASRKSWAWIIAGSGDVARLGEVEGVVDVEPVAGDVDHPGRLAACDQPGQQVRQAGLPERAVRRHTVEFRPHRGGTRIRQLHQTDPFAVRLGDIRPDRREGDG